MAGRGFSCWIWLSLGSKYELYNCVTVQNLEGYGSHQAS